MVLAVRGKLGAVFLITFILAWSSSACSSIVAPQPTETPIPTPAPSQILIPTLSPSATILPALPQLPGKASVEGVVIGGGDQTPPGRQGGPRSFVYQVRTESGEVVLVTYIALPPSPASDRKPFRLEFHAGEIQIGDYLKAYGSYNPTSLTLTVAEEGDYIETYPSKP